MKFFRIQVLAILLLTAGQLANAQSAVTGAIGGTVSDPNRAVIPNASVTVRNVDTNKENTAATDNDGRFRIRELQPGVYRVIISAPKFRPFEVNDTQVEIGRVTTIDVSLEISARDFGIIDITTAPVINTNQQDFSANFNHTSINELPNNGRRWSTFVLASPATASDGGFGLISFRGINGLLNNNTIDGGDNNQALTSEERGRTRISYVIGLDAIREFQINASNYSAEYGRAAGGVINAVTKSGSNDFHGSAFFYDRDNKLGARNPRGFQTILVNGISTVVPLKPVDKRYQFGGTIGGPILKDGLFFFFSYDQQKRNFPGIAVPSNPAFFTTVDRGTTGAGLKAPNRQLTEAQIDATVAFLTSLTGEVQRYGNSRTFLAKLDWQINKKHFFTASYNSLRWNSPAGVQSNPTVNFGRASFGDDFVNVDSLNLRLTSTITTNLVNEVRFQYGRDNESQFSSTPAPGEPLTGPNGKPPQINITGGFIFGKPTGLDKRAQPDEQRWQYADTVTLADSNHSIKFGFDFNRVRDLVDNLNTEEGSYAYSNINDFIIDYVNHTTNGSLRTAGRVCSGSTRIAGQCYNGNFLQAFGPTAFRFITNDYNFFVQDDYRVRSHLVLNLGMRYEYEQLPAAQIPNQLSNLAGQTFGPEQTKKPPSDQNNFGPRLGFAYDLKGSGETSIRGGYGIYYGRIINSTVSAAITNTGVAASQRLFQVNAATAPSTAPIFPSTFTSPTGTATSPNIVVFDPKMQSPLVHEGDLVFEHLIARNAVVSASYLFSFGRDLPTFIDTNLPAQTSRTYTIIGGEFNGQTLTTPFFASPRPDTRFGAITVVRSLIRSRYHALVLQAVRRLTNGLQFGSSYTLSKATDNGQITQVFSVANAPYNPLDLSADQGPPNFDIRHKLIADAIWSPRLSESRNHAARAIVNGFTFAPILALTSGVPYSATTSGNPAGGVSSALTGAGGTLNRVPLFPRNFFRQPKIVNVDLRVSRRFNFNERMRLVLSFEAFNLFNRTQATGLNTRLYSIGGTATASTLTFDPSFQTIAATGNGIVRERQIQLAVRFEF